MAILQTGRNIIHVNDRTLVLHGTTWYAASAILAMNMELMPSTGEHGTMIAQGQRGSYGGFYCSNYEVAMRSGCTDGSTCCEFSGGQLDSHCFDTSSCSYNEAGQTLWDTLSSSMEGDSFDCFKPQGEDNYMRLYCDPGNDYGNVQRTIFQESDSTCSGTPMYSQLQATCEGDCDRRRLGARGQKPRSSPSFAKRSVRNLRVKPRAVQVDVVKRQN